MITEALEHLAEQAVAAEEPQFVEINGQKYTTRTMSRVPAEHVPAPDSVVHSTLRSLVEYINDDPDGMEEKTFITVVSPTKVEVTTPVIGKDQVRKTWARAVAEIPQHRFGRWMPLDEMSIYLRTCFVESDERDEVVGFIGIVSDDTEVVLKDDGVTQSTTLRHGLSLKREGEVPNVIELAPYSTFHDVEQVERPFIIRLDKQPQVGVVAALFEADAGAWKSKATDRIAGYLEEQVDLKVYA